MTFSHMETQFSRRVSRLFPSPFGSCRFGNVSDVVETSITVAGNSIKPSTTSPVSSSSRIQSSPSKPKSSVTSKNVKEAMKIASALRNFSFGSDSEGRKCPPAKPISPVNCHKRDKGKQSVTVKNSSSSNSGWFSSEEEEEVEDHEQSDPFFTLSSNSSDSSSRKTNISSREMLTTRRRRGVNPCTGPESKSCELVRCLSEASVSSTMSSRYYSETGKNNPKTRRSTAATRRKAYKSRRRTRPVRTQLFTESTVQESIQLSGSSTEYCSCSGPGSSRWSSSVRRCRLVMGGRVEESYAVAKATSDPYGDFRASMVEMIVAKEIYRDEDLEKLLQCFLSLNSSNYHRIILEVFSEICQALAIR